MTDRNIVLQRRRAGTICQAMTLSATLKMLLYCTHRKIDVLEPFDVWTFYVLYRAVLEVF